MKTTQPKNHRLTLPTRARRNASRAVQCLALMACLAIPAHVSAAFGVTDDGTRFVVDTGAGLVFNVNQSNGDITSIVHNGVEYQSGNKMSHIASGLGSAAVSATTYGSDYIKITIATDGGNTVVKNLTHYLMVRNGENTIYMATYATEEPAVGELRWITRLQASKLPNGPVPSDNRNNTGAIESSDVFGMADGTTRSKYYGDSLTRGKERALDLTFCGATGDNVGAWMVFDNRESSSGGPFFRDIENQCGGDQEIYNYMNSGHYQTEAYRLGVLYGPYALVFTDGSVPSLPLDYSWIGGLGLTGWVGDADRGTVSGTVSGIPAGFQGVVGFANSTAQYWATVSSGSYASPLMKPGTYSVKLYKGELEVATDSVSVTAGANTTLNLTSGETTPPVLFRIGEWDGSPAGFLNSDKIIEMHPSDVRMSDWGPVTFVVGTDTDDKFPAYQWKEGTINNPTTVKFNLTADQIKDRVLKIGITAAFAGGRPKPQINAWSPSNPSPSSQPSTRCLTLGTYRGNNTLYTYDVPASAFVEGENSLTLTVISGSSGTDWLSPSCAYDAVELEGDETASNPPNAPSDLTATAVSSSQIDLAWTDNSSDEDGFKIERSLDGSSFSQIATVGANATSYSDTGLSADTTYHYRVRAYNSAGDSDYSNTASATTGSSSGAVDDMAAGETAVSSTVNGTYTDTHASDDVYQSITEIESGGRPNSRYSFLEHKWTFNVTGGSSVTYFVEAHQSASSDGDNFVFAWSTDDVNYTDMLTVTKTSDDNTYQSFGLPNTLSGTVHIRVRDTDRTAGNRSLDTVHVDHMFVRSESSSSPPAAPTGLTATAGDGQVSLSWNASSGAESYNVKRSTTSGGPYTTIATGVTGTTYLDTGLNNGTTYFYVVSAVNSFGESADSDEASATPSASSSMHVQSITVTTVDVGQGNKKGWAEVTIVDSNGNPVSDATVSGTFSGSISETGSGTTDTNGLAVIETTGTAKGGVSITFCVDNVTHATLTYDANANLETCDGN